MYQTAHHLSPMGRLFFSTLLCYFLLKKVVVPPLPFLLKKPPQKVFAFISHNAADNRRTVVEGK